MSRRPENGGAGGGPDDPDGPEPLHRRPRRWIVDGNNVMGARPDGWWRNRRAAAERLVGQVVGLERPPDVEVVLVFDGPGPEGAGQPGISVVYAGATTSADDAILTLVQGAEDLPTLVFTSDAELRGRVRAAGAEVSGARSFLRMVERKIESEVGD
jgi:predicted RNA-binding protein with PIN domain